MISHSWKMSSLEELAKHVRDHLGITYKKWDVAESELGGRGLIANEYIATGEVIFKDHPLIYGPRAAANIPRGCTVCYKLPTDKDKFLKCSSCALLLCSERCQNTDVHYDDCRIISRWNKKIPVDEIDDTLLSRALTPIRALLLDENARPFLTLLAAHKQPQHGSEIRNIKPYFDIPEGEEEFCVLACCVLDTDAFQMATAFGKNEMDKRGLYPVSGLMNSNCTPNTRHIFNDNLEMVVLAAKPIPAGSEVFTCYTGLLWGTPARQVYLAKTKHFMCECDRCADPTERGTLLAAMKCFGCPGSLIHTEPLVSKSPWRCLECGLLVPSKNISAVQNALGSMIGSVQFRDSTELQHFLEDRLIKFVPKTNQIVVDLQCRLIFGLSDHAWIDLPEPQLELKENLCRGTLRTLAALGLGDAHQRGQLLYHLHATLAERARRSPHLYEELKPEIETTIEQAHRILQDDISSPPDLELRRKYLGPGCDKTQEERFFILNS